LPIVPNVWEASRGGLLRQTDALSGGVREGQYGVGRLAEHDSRGADAVVHLGRCVDGLLGTDGQGTQGARCGQPQLFLERAARPGGLLRDAAQLHLGL
jgi:hypothetical protein